MIFPGGQLLRRNQYPRYSLPLAMLTNHGVKLSAALGPLHLGPTACFYLTGSCELAHPVEIDTQAYNRNLR